MKTKRILGCVVANTIILEIAVSLTQILQVSVFLYIPGYVLIQKKNCS